MESEEMITPETHPHETWERGWYEYAGGLRFWENGWTDHYAPPTRVSSTKIDYWRITLAVAAGVVIGWFVIWLGAQASPDHIYWPVKFVVKELPEALR